MALLETLTIGVGAAVAKTALKRWLEDSDFAQAVGTEIVDILKAKIPDFLTLNKADRDFKRIAESHVPPAPLPSRVQRPDVADRC